MAIYEHNRLRQQILEIDDPPVDPEAYANWITAETHIALLEDNAQADSIVIYAAGEYTFAHTVAVPNSLLVNADSDDLLQWNDGVASSSASYCTSGDEVWVERGHSVSGSKLLSESISLVFNRSFDGHKGPQSHYFEVLQEYAHLEEFHFVEELGALCRYDRNGDLFEGVTFSKRTDEKPVSLVTFRREPLLEYLAITDRSLVRMFDFTLLRRGGEMFAGWGDGEETIAANGSIVFRQKVLPGYAAYTRGVQLIQHSVEKRTLAKDFWSKRYGRDSAQYAEFVIQDWRNRRLAKVSADPAYTSNYFEAKNNTLPFDVSPAFFKPEVLLKYKGDKDKYTVGEREVSCRGGWTLQAFDVNEAGQVHAYICYLRTLPYAEQQHWASYNEESRAPISKRALVNDFEGRFTSFVSPLRKVLTIVQRWKTNRVGWWKLRQADLVERVSMPLTSSRDEWAGAFHDLAKLIVEGFETKPIRDALAAGAIPFDQTDRTLALLSKLATAKAGEPVGLEALRLCQRIRTLASGHAGGEEGIRLSREAIAEHGSLSAHFGHVCNEIAGELDLIESLFA